jgi:hypothetical protein
MKRALAALAVVIVAPKWFRKKSSIGKFMFAARASGLLFDLGLDVKRLPVLAQAQFFIEASAVHTTDRRFHPKRLALRFFGWYCVDNSKFDSRALVREGVLVESISIMRAWAAAEPDLANAAEREIHLIVKYLYKEFENLDIDKGEQLHAQLLLLKLAENK